MNSLPDNRLEETIDQLLAASVSPGSEPVGFRIRPMPARPVFPWLGLASALIGTGLFGFLLYHWLVEYDFETLDYKPMLSLDEFFMFISGISSGTWVSLLGIFGLALASILEKLRFLYRML